MISHNATLTLAMRADCFIENVQPLNIFDEIVAKDKNREMLTFRLLKLLAIPWMLTKTNGFSTLLSDCPSTQCAAVKTH